MLLWLPNVKLYCSTIKSQKEQVPLEVNSKLASYDDVQRTYSSTISLNIKEDEKQNNFNIRRAAESMLADIY